MDSAPVRDLAGRLTSFADQLDAERKPPLGVYRGAAPTGPAQLIGYEQWLHRRVDVTHDFAPHDTWPKLTGATFQYRPWLTGRQHLYSVGMLPDTASTLAEGAAGAYDGQWTTFGRNLAAYGLTRWYIRLGWEFNGGWYRWAAFRQADAWAAYWRRIVTAIRAVPGCENTQFVWCPASSWLQLDASTCYPGDEFVDLIGLDLYDQAWGAGNVPVPDPDQRWQQLSAGQFGLNYWIGFARSHGKPFCLPEWGSTIRADGHGGGDAPTFIQRMHDVITDPVNNVAFHCYFDFDAPDGKHRLSSTDTAFPQSAAKFLELFA